MLGAIIGDIAGSFREFSVNRYPELGLLPTMKDMYSATGSTRYGITDDSVLTVATASLLLENEHPSINDFADVYYKFGKRYNSPIGGYGSGFSKWLYSHDRKPYHSCGNGSAMRISPVAWAFESAADSFQTAFNSAVCTHNHPEGIKGAQSTTMMIRLAREGYDFYQIIDRLNKSWLGYEPCEQFDHFDSVCPETMRLAVHILDTTDSFYDAVFKAVTLPHADSDTLGCIVGAVAEGLYGIPTDIREQAMEMIYDSYLKNIIVEFETKFGCK